MARVFVPQHPWKFNQVTRLTHNEGDMSGVLRFGHPIFMLPPGKVRHSRISIYAGWIERHMFDYSADDFVMMTGDSVVQAAAVAIALQKAGGLIRVIRWHPLSNTFRDFALNMRGLGYGTQTADDA